MGRINVRRGRRRVEFGCGQWGSLLQWKRGGVWGRESEASTDPADTSQTKTNSLLQQVQLAETNG